MLCLLEKFLKEQLKIQKNNKKIERQDKILIVLNPVSRVTIYQELWGLI